MRFDTKSIRVRLWIYFVGFAACILILVWALLLFLQRYYENGKIGEMRTSANKLASLYGHTDSFQNEMNQIASQDNMTIVITDIGGTVRMNTYLVLGENHATRLDNNVYYELSENLIGAESGELLWQTDGKYGAKLLIFGRIVESPAGSMLLFVVSSPFTTMQRTVELLAGQLGFVTVIIIALSLILAFLLARTLSKPIENLRRAAGKLAEGDYDVVFESSEYSELNELSDTLNYATKELSRTEEFQRELIANTSHDLRTPLTMIKAYAEMIKDLTGENREKREQNLEVIIDETDRLSGLVNDMLELSKLNAKTISLTEEEVNLSELCRNIMGRYHILSERDGYVFHMEIEEDLYVFADPARLEQVIYNLVNNAINYTGDDKVVTIVLQRQEKSAVFEVKDTGKGIKKDELPYIWDRYYKDKSSHKRAVVGTGLGLSIVKNILDMHGATYGVRTGSGGSTFWFAIEIYRDDVDA